MRTILCHDGRCLPYSRQNYYDTSNLNSFYNTFTIYKYYFYFSFVHIMLEHSDSIFFPSYTRYMNDKNFYLCRSKNVGLLRNYFLPAVLGPFMGLLHGLALFRGFDARNPFISFFVPNYIVSCSPSIRCRYFYFYDSRHC